MPVFGNIKPQIPSIPIGITGLRDAFLYVLFARFALGDNDTVEFQTKYNPATDTMELFYPDKADPLFDTLMGVQRGELFKRYMDWLMGVGAGNSILQDIQDEGLLIGSRPTLNFTGTGVTAVDDPSNNRINVNLNAAVLQVDVQDDGVPTVSNPSDINFEDGLVVNQSGSVADINIDYGNGQTAAVGISNTDGTATQAARADHQHAHDNQGGGSLHAVATTTTAGFMSAADKTILDDLNAISEFIPILNGLHTTPSLSFVTAARLVINFDRLPSLLTMRWNQTTIPGGGATIRLRNITDSTNLALFTTGTTGLKSAAVTNPGGIKLIHLQHQRDGGGGSSDIEGAIIES